MLGALQINESTEVGRRLWCHAHDAAPDVELVAQRRRAACAGVSVEQVARHLELAARPPISRRVPIQLEALYP